MESNKKLKIRSANGIGFVGIGKHKTSINQKPTKMYLAWKSMLDRCYLDKALKHRPTYADCSVDPRWHCFQDFGDWFEENYKPEFMQRWQLDKDILVRGNRIYSPDNCCFVPIEINNLFSSCPSNDLPRGVSVYQNKFRARLHKKTIGYAKTSEEAHLIYETYRQKHVKEVANRWRPLIGEKVYQAILSHITD